MTEGGAGRGPRPHDHPPSLRCIPYTFVCNYSVRDSQLRGIPKPRHLPPPPSRASLRPDAWWAAGGGRDHPTSRGTPPPCAPGGVCPSWSCPLAARRRAARGVRQPKTKRHAAPPCGVGDRPLRRRRVGMYPQRGPQCLSVVAWHGCLRGSVGAAGAVFAGTVRTNRRPLCLSCRCFQCVADPALNRRRHFDGMQTPARRRPRRCARPIRPPPPARG